MVSSTGYPAKNFLMSRLTSLWALYATLTVFQCFFHDGLLIFSSAVRTFLTGLILITPPVPFHRLYRKPPHIMGIFFETLRKPTPTLRRPHLRSQNQVNSRTEPCRRHGIGKSDQRPF